VIAVIKSGQSMLRTVVHATVGVLSVPVQVGSVKNARNALQAIRQRTSTPAAPAPLVRSRVGGSAAFECQTPARPHD